METEQLQVNNATEFYPVQFDQEIVTFLLKCAENEWLSAQHFNRDRQAAVKLIYRNLVTNFHRAGFDVTGHELRLPKSERSPKLDKRNSPYGQA